MFCENCGAKIDDGAAFCTECGAKQSVPEVAPGFTPQPTATSTAATNVAPAVPVSEKMKKVPVYVWIIAAVVIVALIAGGIFLNIRKHTININDYVTVEFDGYDSMGKATVEIDEQFWVDLYEKTDFKDKKKVEREEDFEGDEELIGWWMRYAVDSKIKYEVDPANKLKNGDEVEVSYKVKTDAIKKKYGVTIKAEDKKFTVEGLKKVKSFDPFEGIKVTYSGLDGNGTAKVEVTGNDEVYSAYSYSLSKNYDLSTGDKITVTYASGYSEKELKENCAERFGKVPSATEKEYTVEGLGHYVTDVSELNAKSLAEVITYAQDEIEYDSGFDGNATVNSTDYLGAYLFSKEGDGNYVYLVFEVNADVEDEEGDSESFTYYAVVSITDVFINEDKECDYSNFYGVDYHSAEYESESGTKYNYYGYASLDDVKADMDEEKEWYESYDYVMSTSVK